MAIKTLNIVIPNSLKGIEELTGAFEEFAESNGVGFGDISKFNICFDEIVSNIVKYASTVADQGKMTIHVNISLSDSQLSADIIDEGSPFNPLTLEDPDVNVGLDDREIGGLGILLVKKMMEDVYYKNESGKNILTLTTKLNSDHSGKT